MFPKDICQLTQLKDLRLRNNPIREIPSGIMYRERDGGIIIINGVYIINYYLLFYSYKKFKVTSVIINTIQSTD